MKWFEQHNRPHKTAIPSHDDPEKPLPHEH